MQARQTMQGKVCLFLFILFYLNTTVPAGETPDLYKNQLHFGYGINYKYNGKLYHNFYRVWVVHRVVIPQTQDLKRLPDFPDTVNCIPHVKDKKWICHTWKGKCGHKLFVKQLHPILRCYKSRQVTSRGE